MKNVLSSTILSLFLFMNLNAKANDTPIIWEIDNLTMIGGHSTQTLGEPSVVNSDIGPAVEFDGIDDGLIVDNNPVSGATEFTIEVIFQPYASSDPGNLEQRFIHMQESDDNRLLIELRLTDDNQWFLDTFIKAGASSRVLYAENFPHPIGPWYHAALIYQGGEMRHYVNGKLEMTGNVSYVPVSGGQTSVGVRINKRSWYKGAIHELRVTHRALEPNEFSLLETPVIEKGRGSSTKEFALFQNTPNPFNSSTKIHYSIAEPSHVTLVVYNLQGQRVAKLQNGVQPAADYRVTFDALDLQSGVYFYSLEIGTGFVSTMMMTLIK